MCDPSDKVDKWKCDYCTYENYPSSIKCTMCKGAKPLLNEDIFRLSPPHVAIDADEERGAVADVRTCLQEVQEQNSAASGLSGQKWICKVCTYINWPRSIRCVQCCNKRSSNATINMLNPAADVSGSSSSTTVGNKNQDETTITASAVRHNVCNDELDYNNERTNDAAQLKDKLNVMCFDGGERNTQNTQSNQATNDLNDQYQTIINENASNKNKKMSDSGATIAYSKNSKITNSTLTQQQQSLNIYVAKWACNLCTYENWPKSLKCSMCGEARDGTGEIVIPSISTLGTVNAAATTITIATPTITTTATTTSTAITNNINSMNKLLISEQDELQMHKDTVSTNNTLNKKQQNICQLGSSETINNCDTLAEQRNDRRQRHMRRQVDWQWLGACLGVVENNYSAVEAYLSCGGNPARSLTSSEVAMLNRNSAFDVGHTLIHLAIRFHREEMLPMLLAQISGSGPGIKRVPSYVAPDLAADIRRHFTNILRMRKSMFNCYYVQEHATFSLPAEIEELPVPIQEQLYEELLDRDAQKQLENPPPALNWSLEITARLGSRLLVLWNRSAGDCLLDSAMQSTWGVFDRDNTLRRALADTLHQCGHIFYPRWREYEMLQASMLHFTLEEAQWEEDWNTLLTIAGQPGSSLEQLHIFVLAHILRRPIIVYGVKNVKSFRGEDIGIARFEGVYLPLFWEQNFCIKSPIALGYTRGHFCALVPMEPFAQREEPEDVTFLPLMDCDLKLIPIHFLTQSELGREESIMRQWFDVCVTEGGLLVAQQKVRKRPLLVAQMLEEWLNHYRRIAQVISAPFARRPHQQTGYSSDGDSDEE